MTDHAQWNMGFDAYFSGIRDVDCCPSGNPAQRSRWKGWLAAQGYSEAITRRTPEPRDTEISDLKELLYD